MRIFNLIERPSVLRAVCAPVSGGRAYGLPVADFPRVTQVHQVQAEQPAPTTVWLDGTYGISGFTVKDVSAAAKRLDVRGVPPRGRPV